MSKHNINREHNNLQYPVQPPVKMVRHFYCTVDRGVQPCAPASQYVQMPAVVAPIAVVPYSTTDQPLWQDATENY